ncbi:MAG: hypothetical protein ACREEB_04900 [Caulobacteraceae bacterium]
MSAGSEAIGAWRIGLLEMYRVTKLIVASLASILALTAAGSLFAAGDPTAPPAPTAQATVPATQSPAPAPNPKTALAAKKPSPKDVICKPDPGTGSRVGGVKICLTREEWRQREMD